MTLEEEAQAVLARVADCEEPPLGFTADDIVARGRRQVYARRVRRTAGGAVSMIALVAAVLPLTAFGSRGTGTGTALDRPPDLARLAETDPHCYEEVMAFLKPDDEKLDQPISRLGIRLCPLIRRIHGDLDAQAGSLNTDDTVAAPPLHTDLINYFAPGNWPYQVIANQAYWTPEGRFSFSPSSNQTTSQPVLVEIAVQAPGHEVQYRKNHLDHRQIKPAENGAADPVPWGPATVTTLADGTTVSVHSEQDDAGASIEAARTLKSGVRLFLYIDGAYGAGGAKDFPFTEQQVVAALSVPVPEDVRLPTPPRS